MPWRLPWVGFVCSDGRRISKGLWSCKRTLRGAAVLCHGTELLQTSLQCWLRKGQPALQDSTEGLCTILSFMMMCPMCEHEQKQLLHEWRLQYPDSLQKLTSTVNYPSFTGVLQEFYRRNQSVTFPSLTVKLLVACLSKEGKRGILSQCEWKKMVLDKEKTKPLLVH